MAEQRKSPDVPSGPYVKKSTIIGIVVTAPESNGRSPFAGQEPQPGEPQKLRPDENQVVKSLIIRDFAAEASEARAKHMDALVRLAGGLAQTQKPAEPEPQPTTIKEALGLAFRRLDITAWTEEPFQSNRPEDTEPMVSFPVTVRGELVLIRLPESMLQHPDPVGDAVSVIKERIGEDPLKGRLGVCVKELHDRSIVFDGPGSVGILHDQGIVSDAQEGAGIHKFVYLHDSIGHTFTVPSELKGDGLLRHLEEEIISWHDHEMGEERVFPIPLQVLEAQARREAPQPYPDIEPLARDAAAVLEYLFHKSLRIAPELVPDEYRAALVELRELTARHAVARTTAKMRELWAAIDELDDPRMASALARIEALHKDPDKVDSAAQGEIHAILAEHLSTPIPQLVVCVDALGHLASAYSMLSDNRSLDNAPADELGTKHAFLMHAIRVELKKLAEDGYISIAD